MSTGYFTGTGDMTTALLTAWSSTYRLLSSGPTTTTEATKIDPTKASTYANIQAIHASSRRVTVFPLDTFSKISWQTSPLASIINDKEGGNGLELAFGKAIATLRALLVSTDEKAKRKMGSAIHSEVEVIGHARSTEATRATESNARELAVISERRYITNPPIHLIDNLDVVYINR
jgi:hypothetical protein